MAPSPWSHPALCTHPWLFLQTSVKAGPARVAGTGAAVRGLEPPPIGREPLRRRSFNILIRLGKVQRRQEVVSHGVDVLVAKPDGAAVGVDLVDAHRADE